MYLLGKAFFKLFLNWSRNVRLIFQHLIVFRIYLQSNILRKTKEDNLLIKSQYINTQ
jgi:hypothetical protein